MTGGGKETTEHERTRYKSVLRTEAKKKKETNEFSKIARCIFGCITI